VYQYDVGHFEYPESCAISCEDHIYVSDRVSGNVVVFDKKGDCVNVLNRWTHSLIPPSPTAVCRAGDHFFIADELSDLIYYQNKDFHLQIECSALGLKPSALAYCERGEQLYIADAWNDRIGIVRINREQPQ
jgi:hypothetical protein